MVTINLPSRRYQGHVAGKDQCISRSSHGKALPRPYQLHLSMLSTVLCASWYLFIQHCSNVRCSYVLSLNLCSECSQVGKWSNSARLVGQEGGHAYPGRVQIKRCGSDSAKVVSAAGLRKRDLLGGSRCLWLWWEMWVTLKMSQGKSCPS